MDKFTFIDLDTNQIKKEIKNGYEEIMKTKISAGDPAEDFIDWIVYLVCTSKDYMNFIGKMNLLQYSKGKYLDALGALIDVSRIIEKEAECSVEYTFSKIFDERRIIEKGHKIAKDNLYFESTETTILEPGRRTVVGKVKCLVPGLIGNDIEVGEINAIVDDIPYLLSVSNITKTSGGADREEDDSYRNRIRLRPRAFSVAGPHGAYQYYTLTSHQDIKDSYIYTPSATPGIVKIIPLLKNGELPSQEILEKIKEKLADDVRPLTDKIEIEKPKIQSYNIDIKYWTKKGDNPILVKKEVEAAFSEYIYWQKEKLGRDINPNKLTQLLILAGAKRVEITSPIFQKIEKDTVAKELTKSIKYIGEEDE